MIFSFPDEFLNFSFCMSKLKWMRYDLLLRGHNLISRRKNDLVFSTWATFFTLFVGTLFSVHFTQIYYHLQALTWGVMCLVIAHYTFHAHCFVIYFSLRKMQTHFVKVKISSNFPLKLSVLSFFTKSKQSTPIFYSLFGGI